jgi:hypothetical protein
MSWRIEDSNALAVLRELPSRWAQTCVTRPPRDVPVPTLLAVLAETRRVLRGDGTLWLALPASGTSSRTLSYLEETSWLTPGPYAAAHVPSGVRLFSKQPWYLFHPQPGRRPVSERRQPPRAGVIGEGCEGCRSRRRAFCVAAPGVARGVIEWCVLSSTVSRACGVCGAPWLPDTSTAEQARSGCVHTNGRGRSLVIDPFCGSATTALIAQRRGRDFLGIAQSPETAARIRRRLALADWEARR